MEKYFLYIVLTRTNTVISNLIHMVTNDDYTHAAISLDKELESMYSFARRNTYNPFIGRFKKEDINEGIYKFNEILPGTIIEVEVTKEQYEKAKALIDSFINNSDKYKYNYRGLIYNLLNKPVTIENRFLCSEFVYFILKESGVVDFNIARNLVKPQDLLKVNGKIIYEGNLREIKPLNNRFSIKEMIKSHIKVIS